jgi:hypothetical protein
MGQIMVSQVNLEMAMKAQDMLDALFAEKGAAEAAAQRALVESNEEAKFLHGKIMAAKWFFANILPHHKALVEAFNKRDVSALEVVF